MIESGNNDTAVGGAGEVSRFQIKPWVWRRYSRTDAYRNRQISSSVAEKYLTELEATFRKRAGREPDDFDLYVLWNAGPTYYGRIGYSRRKVHPVIRERAQRFVNLRQKNDTEPDRPRAMATPASRGTITAPRNETNSYPFVPSSTAVAQTPFGLDGLPPPVVFTMPVEPGLLVP